MTSYPRHSKQQTVGTIRPSKRSMLLFVAIIAVAIFVVVFSLWNSTTMQSASRENAREYVSELTIQISGTINNDQADKKSMLVGISDALTLLFSDGIQETGTDDYMRSYLESANESGQFDEIVFFRNGELVCQSGDVPADTLSKITYNHPAVQECLQKNTCIAYIEGDYVLYAAPVYRYGEVAGVLVGAVNVQTIRDLVDVQTYRDESNFCLVNREGKLLMASGDGRFNQAKSVLEDGSVDMTQLSRQMEADFASGTSKVVDIVLDDDQAYFLSYAPIEGEDWVMLTLFPVDMFSGIYKSYMLRALACTVAAAAVFVILLMLLRSVYRRTKKKLEEVAFTDDLTKGPNVADFRMRYEALQKRGNPLLYSIVLLDVKDFKLVNEWGGFAMGDRMLRQVYRAIEDELNEEENEFASRAEMDHFFVCMRTTTQSGLQERIDRIAQTLEANKPRRFQGFSVEFGQGACVVDDAATDVSVLQERARIAKQSGDNEPVNCCIMFTREMQKKLSANRRLDHMAEESMANHDFVVYYQPKVSMSGKCVKGAEALVRWNHPERGIISPAEFIPVLEDSGRIQALDRYVFEDVCFWLSRRQEAGKTMFPVSVNLSRTHFWNDDFLQPFVDIANKYQINRDYVEFEITETVLMEEAKHVKIKEGIAQMHEQGFRCSVDDFGVGYSSLSLVHKMDVDTLKFDRSFFTNLQDEKARKIVRCLMNMANELQMDMVIEGIETQEQIDFLINEQCDVIQGYYYSRPLPEKDFEAWVDNFS